MFHPSQCDQKYTVQCSEYIASKSEVPLKDSGCILSQEYENTKDPYGCILTVCCLGMLVDYDMVDLEE